MREIRTENATITSTFLGREDHGILTFYIACEGDGWGCSFGGYSLDGYDKATKKRVCSAKSMQSVVEILDTVGVGSWEELKGKNIRVKSEGWGGCIIGIGNFIKDKWFTPKEFYNAESNEED